MARGDQGIGIEMLEPRLALAVVPIKLGTMNDDAAADRTSQIVAQLNGISYFVARNVTGGAAQADAGMELWRTDDTPAGTYRLKDINPGSASSNPAGFLVVGNTLYFSADDGLHGDELWKTDGTAAGTVMVKDINESAIFVIETGLMFTDPSSPTDLTNVNGTLFFTATNGWNGREVWKTDGTAAGTVMVKDINPGKDLEGPQHLTNVGGRLMFSANDGVNGRELWKSDGTAAGTVLVKDILPGPLGSNPGTEHRNQRGIGALSPFIALNGNLYFLANEELDFFNGFFRSELWKSDGTTAGTTRLKADCAVFSMASSNGLIFFTTSSATDQSSDSQLWKTDGTIAGTTMLRDFGPGSGLGYLSNFKGTLLLIPISFDTDRREIASELWRSNGTVSGTVRVTKLATTPVNGDEFDSFGAARQLSYSRAVRPDGMYFSNIVAPNGILDAATSRVVLWKSDGTAAGTMEVQSALSGRQTVMPASNRLDGGTLYADGPLQVAAGNLFVPGSPTEIYRFLPPRPTPDINGDGRADVIGRNTVTGQVVAEIRNTDGTLRETRSLGYEGLPVASNGSFETPVIPPRTIKTYKAGASLGSWRVLEGDVDLEGSGYWQHAEGLQSLDLNGTIAGSICQDVPTTAGAKYDLTLRLAGNVEGGPAVKTADIYWGPVGAQTLLRQVTFDTTGRSKADMGWTTVSLPNLAAVGPTARITIVSRTAGAFGAVIDDVRLVPSGPANKTFVAAADVSGDGVSDLIWRVPTTGSFIVWVRDVAGNVTRRQQLASSQLLNLVATGDYNADGYEDLIWRNSSSGTHVMWLMGPGLTSSKRWVTAAPEWRIVAASPGFDANDDGKTDLVWRNIVTNATSLWLMDGSNTLATLALANGSAGGDVVGTGDFNGDGHGDVLWRSASTGKVTQQLLRNGVVQSSAVIGGDLDSAVAWTGDVNGDRRTDILWNKQSTAANTTWLMNGKVRQAIWAAIGDASRWSVIRRPGR